MRWIRNSVWGWRDPQEILAWINVFGLALPHAGCLEDTQMAGLGDAERRETVPASLLSKGWWCWRGGLLIYFYHRHSILLEAHIHVVIQAAELNAHYVDAGRYLVCAIRKWQYDQTTLIHCGLVDLTVTLTVNQPYFFLFLLNYVKWKTIRCSHLFYDLNLIHALGVSKQFNFCCQ